MVVYKNALGVISGCITGVVLISAGEMCMYKLFPFPVGIDSRDAVAMGKAIASMPSGAFIFLLAIYIVASFCGGIVSTLITGRQKARPAFIAGIILTLAGVYNTWHLPHPLWFTLTDALVYIPAAYLGFTVSKKKTTTL